jgi:hypothetical protein
MVALRDVSPTGNRSPPRRHEVSMGKSVKVERKCDGMPFPTIQQAAIEEGVDPATIANWMDAGYKYRRVYPTPEELERRRMQKAERVRKQQARYYQNRKERRAKG